MDRKIDIRRVYDPQAEGYYRVPMLIRGRTVLKPEKINQGLGGITFTEVPAPPFSKDLDSCADEPQAAFDTTNWAYFMAFSGTKPVGGITVASRSPAVLMLDGRDDLAVLWDVRVLSGYRRKGVGTALLGQAVTWCREQGLRHMKVECQASNVAACKFYVKAGAVLGGYNEYAYMSSPALRHEIQLLWWLDLEDGAGRL